MHLPLRSLPCVALAAALLSGCAGAAGTPPVSAPGGGAVSQSAVRFASDDRAAKLHFRLIAPLESEFVRTGVMLWSASAVCANEHVPKKLSKRGFPLDAAALQPPRSATVRVAIDAIALCSQKGHEPDAKGTVVPMTVATPTPAPAATPSFGGDGYYVVALAADAGGRVSVLDVSGPLDAPADGPFAFENGVIQLSSDSMYAFYLAKVRATPNGGDSGGDDDDEAF